MRNHLILLAGALLLSSGSLAAESAAIPSSPQTRLPVDRVKERYWDKGREAELRVVQNRLYSKAQKLELGIYGGFISTDPFLSAKNLGLSLSYHLSDTYAITGLAWKDFVSSSSALTTLETSQGVTANTNIPSYFYGGEFDFVPIYGKLSLLGTSIIYFDMHLDAGIGVTHTETGSDFTNFFGIGQQIYLNSFSSLLIDYRLITYSESVKQKTTGAADYGQIVRSDRRWDSVITIGVTVFGKVF